MRGVCLGAYEHESYPFERAVEWAAGGGRELSYSPLVQVMLAMQEEPLQRSRWGSLEVRREPYEGRVAKFDLTLLLGEEAAGEDEGDSREGCEVRGRLEYRAELFDAWRMRAMASHLRNLLAAAVADPDRKLSQLPLLGEEERHQLTVGWNQTQADYEGGLAHELFAAQAARTPDAVAASDEGGHLTYAELDRRTNRLARRLRRLGVGPEKVVALHLPRGLRLVEAALGVLKAGGVYLPLDITSPAARLRLMVEDAGAVVVLAESDAPETFAGSGATLVGLADSWPLVARESAEGFTPEVAGENLAYVIYTSGSTGRPKGVQITHEGLANLIHWHRNAFGVTPSDRATLLASPAFDASVWELWPYLTAGASVHVPDAETQYSPDLLREWLARRAVTITFLPTPLAESLLASEWPKGDALRTMLTGGDKLQRYPDEGLGFELVNNYGPTESCVVATSGLISAKDHNDSPPPIGRPVANTRAYVLDAAHEPAPAGVPGQLALAGRGLMRGYVGRPDQTAERLRPDHLWTEPGARLYLTGDLVRHLPDGRLEFHGRLDRQLKMRGLRIEPGEVEAALCEHPSVRRAAVEIDESGDAARLVAYVVSEPGGAPAGELREHLRARIPDYMVPSRYVRLEELPLTVSGKVDRARLPTAGGEVEEGRAAEFVGARNAVEEVLVGVFEEVLGVRGVGAGDDFFALGGHSLLAA
ncbi:MAG: amino acid adenylation domain-containing protein, partial [Acidobacteria bacterium]|nr:amino acid adenylation domain-containing protein [Acidobacteriota bacterium]